jgi:hypothetical protein
MHDRNQSALRDEILNGIVQSLPRAQNKRAHLPRAIDMPCWVVQQHDVVQILGPRAPVILGAFLDHRIRGIDPRIARLTEQACLRARAIDRRAFGMLMASPKM